MKIYISSTFNDLKPYRARVADTLREAGHTVFYMEEYAAQESRPLERCIEHVGTADLFVGIYAWRYGYVPKAYKTKTRFPAGVIPGKTSITEAEYHAAGDAGIARLVFMLDDSEPWVPAQLDTHTGEGDGGNQIVRLRSTLSEDHIVGFFTSPDNLATRVLAAVQRQDVSKKLELRTLQQIDAHEWIMRPQGLEDTMLWTITQNIRDIDDQTYMVVDIGRGQKWWSTRLYFLASLLVDLTNVRLLAFVDHEERLFGVTNAVSLRNALARRIPAIRDYETMLESRDALDDIETEIQRRGDTWETAMNNAGGEHQAKSWVRKQELGKYLGEALIKRSVEWPPGDRGREAVMDVVDQIVKWPQDLVPVIQDGKFFKIVERDALTEEIARIFVEERARLLA